MGCTPSKQVDASREDSNGSTHDNSNTEKSIGTKDLNAALNGNSKINASNGNFTEKSKGKKNAANESRQSKGRPVLTTSKAEKKCTQSQLDFFEMLDRKIDAGPDYASEDEKASRAWSESRYNYNKPRSRANSLTPVHQT